MKQKEILNREIFYVLERVEVLNPSIVVPDYG